MLDALNVSYLLTTVQADAETISANILSYLLMNELVKRNELEKDFDFNIVKLASNINKLKSISLSTENDYLISTYILFEKFKISPSSSFNSKDCFI